jgi:hypothetical protein
MQTEELIRNLSADLPRVAPGAVARRVALGLGLGALGSAAVMLAWLGPRPDLAQAVLTPMFWMKFSYAAATGLIAAAVLARLARPAARPGVLAALIAAPFVVVAAMALVRFAQAPPQARYALLMGHTSMICPWRSGPCGAWRRPASCSPAWSRAVARAASGRPSTPSPAARPRPRSWPSGTRWALS